MARELSCMAQSADEGKRLDSFLAEHNCYVSRSAAAKHCEAGDVLVRGVVSGKKTILQAGDMVIYAAEEEAQHAPMVGIDIPLDIRFEDDDLLVISKQAGLCIHPAPNHIGPTLVNALIYRYGRDNLAHVQGDDRPGIVHRLDMETSGLMLCAKDDEAGLDLQEAIRFREIDRHYLTLVHGTLAMDTGMIDAPIGRHEKQRLRMCVSSRDNARPAETTFKVLERFEAGPKDNGYSLVECKLFTGRTHQIRVHMEYIKHCCVGDPVYRSGSDFAQLGLDRQFLHSYLLNFTHPKTEERLHFVDKLPADLAAALDKLSGRSMGKTRAGEEVFAMIDSEGITPSADPL